MAFTKINFKVGKLFSTILYIYLSDDIMQSIQHKYVCNDNVFKEINKEIENYMTFEDDKTSDYFTLKGVEGVLFTKGKYLIYDEAFDIVYCVNKESFKKVTLSKNND